MKDDQYAPYHQTRQWHQIELTVEYIILGFLGTIFTSYAQKIEGLVLGSQWITPSLLFSAGILLAACRYRRQIIDSTSWCTVRIRDLEFQVQWNELSKFYPIWQDLSTSEDVSRADILDALTRLQDPVHKLS